MKKNILITTIVLIALTLLFAKFALNTDFIPKKQNETVVLNQIPVNGISRDDRYRYSGIDGFGNIDLFSPNMANEVAINISQELYNSVIPKTAKLIFIQKIVIDELRKNKVKDFTTIKLKDGLAVTDLQDQAKKSFPGFDLNFVRQAYPPNTQPLPADYKLANTDGNYESVYMRQTLHDTKIITARYVSYPDAIGDFRHVAKPSNTKTKPYAYISAYDELVREDKTKQPLTYEMLNYDYFKKHINTANYMLLWTGNEGALDQWHNRLNVSTANITFNYIEYIYLRQTEYLVPAIMICGDRVDTKDGKKDYVCGVMEGINYYYDQGKK